MSASLALATSARTRYATGAMMYFAQGVPYGLMNIAIPAWLASQGVGAGEIASFLAVIVLPWAFKLLSGPLMDHYEFLPMGRRRPWVLVAQLGLTLSFFCLMFVERPAEQIGLLMLLGVFINVFAATQDVAVDGMSIDLTPIEEQGRLNAFMTFGKAMGWGLSSAASGLLLVNFGLGVTAAAAACVTGTIFVAFTLVVERPGERRLPWSAGEAVLEPRPGRSFSGLFRGLKAVMWTRVSLILMGVMFFDGLVGGYGHALMPIAAVKLFGFTTPQWSSLVAIMGLAGAAGALALGPLIDRFGAKRMLFLTTMLVGLHALLLAETQALWRDTLYVKVMLSIWIMMGPVTMVCMIALAMAICSSVNSATQFAIYMSIANLGNSAGAKIYGLIADRAAYHQAYVLLGTLAFGLIVVLSFYRHRHATERTVELKTAPRYPVGLSTSGGGTYFSGAIRCPKCHADMDILDVDGIEVDRCSGCQGLWFDAGESDRLRDAATASAIDVGSAATGRAHNRNDQYRCPRCGGEMAHRVDSRQRHIWYEECRSCHGTYFDAGEFSDLATESIADLFRSLAAPRRRRQG